MSILVRAAPPKHLPWLFDRIGCSPTAHFKGIEAIDEPTGYILGIVGFDNWTESCVEMHFATESKLAVRRLLIPAFSYPFQECGLSVVVGKVRASNKRAMALDRHLGFREVYRLKDGAAVGDDLILFEMRKEECRWLDRQQRRAA